MYIIIYYSCINVLGPRVAIVILVYQDVTDPSVPSYLKNFECALMATFNAWYLECDFITLKKIQPRLYYIAHECVSLYSWFKMWPGVS